MSFSPATTPTGFHGQRFWGFISLHWSPGLHCLSCSPVVPPSLSAHECEISHPPDAILMHILPNVAAISAPPTDVDECFFFNSLVVGLLYHLIFWKFWLFLFLNQLLSFFWLCKETKYIYLLIHLGQKPKLYFFIPSPFSSSPPTPFPSCHCQFVEPYICTWIITFYLQ